MLEAQSKDGREENRMKEAQQDQCPHGGHSGSEQYDCQASQGRNSEKRKQAGRRNMLHDGGAGKPANHESQEMELEIIGGMFLRKSGHAVLCKTDDKAGNPYLRAHIEELRRYAFQ